MKRSCASTLTYCFSQNTKYKKYKNVVLSMGIDLSLTLEIYAGSIFDEGNLAFSSDITYTGWTFR